MNNIVSKTKALLFLVMFIVSCSHESVEIIEQDTSWKIDDKYITEDIREQLNIDPFKELIYISSPRNSLLEVEAINDLKETVIVGSQEVSFKIRVTKAYSKDIDLKIVNDDELLKQFPVNIDDIPVLPESSYALASGVLKAGEMETTLTFKFNDVSALDNRSGYVLALRLEMNNEQEGVAMAKTRSTFFIKLKLKVQLDNIDSSNTTIEGEGFNKDVTFESNTRPADLYTLNDGNFTTNKWYTSNEKQHLTVILAQKTLITGFRFDTSTGSSGAYMLKSCKVLVEMPNGEWLNNGVFERETMGGIAYIRFKTPMECTKVRFEDLKAFNNRYSVDANEITVFK